MTTYHGGKNRIGKEIADVIFDESVDIEEDYNFNIKGYCEPFCGMLGVYRHIHDMFGDNIKYKAGDLNKSLILMWKSAQRGWKPPEKKINKREFMDLKNSLKSSPKKGFVGHLQSFRSIYFGGYATHITQQRIKKAAKDVREIAKKLGNVSFKQGDYTQFSNLKGYILYCDPPYENGEQRYKEETGKDFNFDSNKFWDWCRKMSENNIVFVSNYRAPSDFEKVWRKGKEKLYLMY